MGYTHPWTYYLPGDLAPGEVPTDHMRELHERFPADAPPWRVADAAVADDWCNHDGWERGTDKPFSLIVVAPDGAERRFICEHVAEVQHVARSAPQEDEI